MSKGQLTRQYMTGFGNEFASEAVAGTLPAGRNSPKVVAHGLYAEKFSATAFTAPRAQNFRSWFYRIRPSVVHGEFRRIDNGLIRTAPDRESVVTPNPLRWDPYPIPNDAADFIDGLTTVASNGDASAQRGMAIHIYRANRSMTDRWFYNADGELLFIPESGALVLHTECGSMDLAPGSIAVIPRGLKFRVEIADETVRGYVCENYGAMLQLPERGPIGSDGLANSRDFETPVAAFEDRQGDFQLLCKFSGAMYVCDLGHSPQDVVGWHGNLAPYRYNLRRFNTIGSISYDHPDPSIFTVLTSQSDTAGIANIDFVIFPPRWLVMENTFRPPWYHRNVMSEYMGLIYGEYDAKTGGGFVPGGSSLHNSMSAHGPDADAYAKAIATPATPQKIDNTMAFMLESRYVIQPSKYAMQSNSLQADYTQCWQDLPGNFRR